MTQPDGPARRAELEEAVAAAEAERREVRHQAQDAAMRVRELRDQLAARASDHPDEFGEDGAAKAKTEASKLHRRQHRGPHP